MYKFKRLMIGLDMSYMDEILLKYAQNLVDVLKPEAIYFLNIQPNLDLDDDIKELLGGDNQPSDEVVKENMKQTVAKFFKNNSNASIDYKVVEGNPSQEILRWTKIKEIDLLIMGRKELKGGSGITPQQVSAKVMSSVLIIPEGIERYNLNKILVPIDFSDYSMLALEETLYLKSLKKDIEIKCHHVYNLPLGYEKTGKTADEFSEIMKTNAEKKFKKMQSKIDGAASIECTFELSDDKSIGKQIKEAADKESADLIVMGAKGRTLATQIFLGSATEKLIKFQSNSALLVVKDKSSIFDFWKFFESI